MLFSGILKLAMFITSSQIEAQNDLVFWRPFVLVLAFYSDIFDKDLFGFDGYFPWTSFSTLSCPENKDDMHELCECFALQESWVQIRV